MVIPLPKPRMIAIGFEGSANKLGIGIIEHTETECRVLANIRHTYITPPGQGFLPRDTAAHHREHVLPLVKAALKEAGVVKKEIDVVCYTKGVFEEFVLLEGRKTKRR